MQEKLKAILPRLIWSMFSCISGWHGIQMLWGERPTTGVANILVCMGLVVLAIKWPVVMDHFAPSPIVLRTGTVVLISLSWNHLLASSPGLRDFASSRWPDQKLAGLVENSSNQLGP